MSDNLLFHFEKSYENELKPILQLLDEDRKRSLKKILLIWCIIAILDIIVCIVIMDYSSTKETGILFLPILIAVLVGGFIYHGLIKKYKNNFKKTIIGNLVKLISEEAVYYPESHITGTDFKESRLYTSKYNRFMGSDLVFGKLGSTLFKFSRLYVAYNTGSGKKERHKKIFNGTFFVADFNKYFNAETLVYSDNAERIFGSLIGRKLQTISRSFSESKLIELEDPEFEKRFAVFSSDQVEARYILSTSLMKRITELDKRTKGRIQLSFINGTVNIAIPQRKSYLKPRVFKSIVDKKLLLGYFNYLILITGIIEDLNLNTRIWTKK